jgi:excisionase family DNA binding protein
MLMKLFTVQETAEALNLKVSTIRAWTLRRKLNSFRIGRAVRISAEEVERILHDGLRPAIGPQRKG